MAERIVFDTGLKTYEIEFSDRGEVVEIQFNPTDEDLPIRLSKVKDNLDKRMAELNVNINEVNLNEEGVPDVDEGMQVVEQFEQATKIVYDELDKAFGNPICDKVFKYCNPFSVVNGNYFFLQFIEAITPVIEKAKKAESGKANANMEKYLKKYKGYIK